MGDWTSLRVKNKNGESILGYRVSGRYTYRGDDDPTAIPVYRATDEKIAEIEANPITFLNNTRIASAEFLTNEDVIALDAKPFEALEQIDLTAKLEARLSKTIDISFTGTILKELAPKPEKLSLIEKIMLSRKDKTI